MAAINSKRLKLVMELFRKEKGRGMTVEELKRLVRGGK